MPREDDPRFGPGGQFARKPGGVDYAPPQLTLEAARAYEAYDRAREREKAERFTSTVAAQGRAMEPWETEDRIAYNQARRQREEEARRLAAEHRRQQEARLAGVREELRRRMAPAAPLMKARDYYGLAGRAAQQEEAQRAPSDFRPLNMLPPAEGERGLASATRPTRAVLPGQAFAQAGADLLGTDLPGMKRVQQVAGDTAQFLGENVRVNPIGAGMGAGVGPTTPEQKQQIGDLSAGIAEGFIPTTVGGLLLELIPGIGTVPGVASAVRGGMPALRALARNAGMSFEEYIASRAGREALLDLMEKRGIKQIAGASDNIPLGPGDEAAKAAAGAGEAASSSLPADALPLPSTSLAPVREAFSGKHGRVRVGTRVFATDRNNFGRVVQLNPNGTAKVYFRSPQGGEAFVDLPPDTLNPLVSGGRRTGTKVVPLTNAELTQSWELLPAENQKFVGIVAEHSLTEVRRAELLKASRTRKAGNIADISRGAGSADEKLAQMWAARRGADLPEQPALKEFFDDADIASYERQIIEAVDNQLVTPHEATNAGSILKLIMEGARRDGAKTPITQGERSLMGKIFGPELEKVLPTTPQKMSLLQKFLAPFQLHRALRTALDLGAMFRQGRKVILSDFHEWARASRTQFRALGQQGYERVQEVVHSSPYYSLGQSTERPLGIMEQGAGLSDEFLSPLTKPSTGTGIRKRVGDVVLAPIRVSERTYNGFLNTLRQGIFDKNMDELVKAAGSLDKVSMSEVQRIIDNINTATMFGNISALGDYQKAVSQTLFSVRSLVSGPQFYADVVRALGPDASPAARKIILRRFASVIASDLATLGSVAAVGAYLKAEGSPIPVSVNMDPYSQSLGDVQVGPVKWNIWGPEVQMVRATLQAATGKRRPEGSSETKDINAFDRAAGFGRTKLSPTAAVFYDLFLNKQRDFQGRPIKDRAWQYALEQAAPIMGPSMHDAFRENGFWGAAGAGQGVGLDVQVYGPSKTVEKANAKASVLKALDDIGYTKLAADAYAANLPALQAKIGTAGNYKTLAELYKAHMTPTGDFKPTRTQIEQREKDFRALPAVKKIKASIQQRETAILKAAPPGLAQAAYEAGEVDLTVTQKRILGIK